MFTKTNLISTLITAIWAYLGGFLFWAYLCVDFFNDHLGSATGVMKDPPDMFHLIIGCIIFAFVFSNLFRKWANNNYSAGSGIVFGIWLAALIGLGDGLINFATSNILDITGTFANFGIYIIFLGIMGALSGIVYKNIN